MLKTWNGRALAMAAGVALAASAPTARAEVAGGVIGCDASGNKQIAGALIGGVIGGVAGNNIIKKDQQAGTIVGATAGAAAGSYVGCNMQKKDAERAYAPPPRVVYEAPPSPPPPPARVRYYEEAPPTYVVREPPPRTVVYEEAPPPPPRNVYVQERYDDDDWDDDHWKHKRYKYRPDPRWARDAYYVPRGHGKRYLIGERMPVTYVRREYVIYEPARYRLRPAPVGYSWVMYGGDAYLVGTQTGVVAQIVRAILG